MIDLCVQAGVVRKDQIKIHGFWTNIAFIASWCYLTCQKKKARISSIHAQAICCVNFMTPSYMHILWKIYYFISGFYVLSLHIGVSNNSCVHALETSICEINIISKSLHLIHLSLSLSLSIYLSIYIYIASYLAISFYRGWFAIKQLTHCIVFLI